MIMSYIYIYTYIFIYIYIASCAPGNLAWQLCSATCHFYLRIGYNRCRTNKPMSVEGLVVAEHIGLAPSLELRWRVVSVFTTPKLGFRIFCPGPREHLLRKAMFLDGQRVNLWFPQCSLKSVSCETHLISSWWAPANVVLPDYVLLVSKPIQWYICHIVNLVQKCFNYKNKHIN